MKTKKAGLMTKLVILALLIYMATSLLDLRAQISTAQAQLDTLDRQVTVQTQENAQLAEAIANSDDPAVLERAARDRGYVRAGERILVDVAN
jgi:cell division protein FtsB